ncbi:hypothetical protein Sjap_007935 [Stephania japonica]|uniref:Uncharacterized protein n=1 Tax=Stephania japonica TaxID=461633 RepID=A0AAP0JPG1_9MAGN
MTLLPSCFSNPSNPSDMPQNLVTCIYQTHLSNTTTTTDDDDEHHQQQLCYLTLTWCKTLLSHTLTIHASPDLFTKTISLHPPSLSLFRSKSGSKSVPLNTPQNRAKNRANKVKLYWDFSKAQFAPNSAEPINGFYFSIVSNAQIRFVLGDLRDSAIRRSGLARLGNVEQPTLLSRREHVFGRKRYATTAQLLGAKREIGIECCGGALKVKIDGSVSLVVKRLGWKFRGNERILVGGVGVEFYWDVLNWVSGGSNNGHGVFVFQVGDGGVWPEMVGAEKRLMRKSTGSGSAPLVNAVSSPSPAALLASSCSSSVLQWAEESSGSSSSSSDGGRSSCSSSTARSCGSVYIISCIGGVEAMLLSVLCSFD